MLAGVGYGGSQEVEAFIGQSTILFAEHGRFAALAGVDGQFGGPFASNQKTAPTQETTRQIVGAQERMSQRSWGSRTQRCPGLKRKQEEAEQNPAAFCIGGSEFRATIKRVRQPSYL